MRGSGIARRRLLQGVAAVLAAGRAPAILGAARPRVVVLGAGAAGGVAARVLASEGDLDVTLVEPEPRYVACFSGNAYLAGLRSFDSIEHRRDACAPAGIRLVADAATGIDADARRVTTRGGATIPYDRLVVAPGIGFAGEGIEGYDADAAVAMPHGFSGGEGLRVLRARLESIPEDGLFLVAPPAGRQRCPPAPYERVSLVASWLGVAKPGVKILVVDAKDAFPLQELFLRAWERHYPDTIEWLPGELTGGVVGVDAARMEVRTADETIAADVINLIPPQRAGDLAVAAGLVDDSSWCPVDPLTLESTIAPGVHVIGDAAGIEGLPKSAFVAESQAAICASAIRHALLGKPAPAAGFENRCYSAVAPGLALRLGARYVPDGAGVRGEAGYQSTDADGDAARRAASEEAAVWERAFLGRMLC